MRRRILLENVVNIVGADQIDAGLFMKPEKLLINQLLLFYAMILKLQKEIPLSEYLLITQCRCLSLIIIVNRQMAGHFTCQTGTQRNDALMVFFQGLIINTRFIIISLRKAGRYDFHQIMVTGIIFRQQNKMKIPEIIIAFLPVKPGTGAYIDFAADNRLNPRILTRSVKIDHTVHDTVISDCQTVKPQLFRLNRNFIDFGRTVQQTELRMHMQMRKCHFPTFFLLLPN